MFGDRCGVQHPIGSSDRGAVEIGTRSRSTKIPPLSIGPAFISRAILRWATGAKIDTAFIDPRKPWQNGSNESFNGKFRDERLGMQRFKNRIDAKILIEAFRRQYNEVRPHSSLVQMTPAEFKQNLLTMSPEPAIS
jgi:transposase InsO family protein